MDNEEVMMTDAGAVGVGVDAVVVVAVDVAETGWSGGGSGARALRGAVCPVRKRTGVSTSKAEG